MDQKEILEGRSDEVRHIARHCTLCDQHVWLQVLYCDPCFLQGVDKNKDERRMRLCSLAVEVANESHPFLKVVPEGKPHRGYTSFQRNGEELRRLPIRLVKLPSEKTNANVQNFVVGGSRRCCFVAAAL